MHTKEKQHINKYACLHIPHILLYKREEIAGKLANLFEVTVPLKKLRKLPRN
jgi:hypothetical protein